MPPTERPIAFLNGPHNGPNVCLEKISSPSVPLHKHQHLARKYALPKFSPKTILLATVEITKLPTCMTLPTAKNYAKRVVFWETGRGTKSRTAGMVMSGMVMALSDSNCCLSCSMSD